MEKIYLNGLYTHEKGNIDNFLKAFKKMEKLFPKQNLRHHTLDTGKTIVIEDLDNWVKGYYKKWADKFAFLHNGKPEETFISITLNINLEWYKHHIESKTDPLLYEVIDFRMSFPYQSEYLEKAYELISIWSNENGLFLFSLYSGNEVELLGKQINKEDKLNFVPPYGLPPLPRNAHYKKLRPQMNILVPTSFSWLQFWSKATCEYIDWSEDKAGLFHKVEQLDNGGRILQLTEEPFNDESETHLEALKHAYLAFPKVGGRYWFEQLDSMK